MRHPQNEGHLGQEERCNFLQVDAKSCLILPSENPCVF